MLDTINQEVNINENMSLDKFFYNLINGNKTEDEKLKKINLFQKIGLIFEYIFNRIERICLMIWGNYFNEEDLAILFRIPDPRGAGKNTIRNYALRSRKIPFAKVGRQTLLFNKKDIERLYEALRSESIDVL